LTVDRRLATEGPRPTSSGIHRSLQRHRRQRSHPPLPIQRDRTSTVPGSSSVEVRSLSTTGYQNQTNAGSSLSVAHVDGSPASTDRRDSLATPVESLASDRSSAATGRRNSLAMLRATVGRSIACGIRSARGNGAHCHSSPLGRTKISRGHGRSAVRVPESFSGQEFRSGWLGGTPQRCHASPAASEVPGAMVRIAIRVLGRTTVEIRLASSFPTPLSCCVRTRY
jgi:hypothetical protein